MGVAVPSPAAELLPRYMTVPQFCERFQISRTTGYDLLKTGKLRSVKIGHSRRIPVSAVLAYAESLDIPNDEGDGGHE